MKATSPPYAERYDLIDAWRGLAALAVVVHHVAAVNIGGVAVMVFFVISGYCIAAAADACQRRGLSFGSFMFRRVRRIYPPYLLAVAFYVATRLVKIAQGGGNDLAKFSSVEWLQNLTLTQWLTLSQESLAGATRSAAPDNPSLFVAAFWSLCYEEQFYLITGGLLVLASLWGLRLRLSFLALSVASLVWCGFFPQGATGLFIEYFAVFGVGALVFFRLCRMGNARGRRAVDAVLVGLALVAGYLWLFSGIRWQTAALDGQPESELLAGVFPNWRNAWADLFIGSLFALVLIALRPLNDRYRRSWLAWPLGALGAITFSLYLIHQFNLVLIAKAVRIVLPGLTSEWIVYVANIAAHVALASVFWYFCERPFLNKPLAAGASRSIPPSGLASAAPVAEA
jgi:peptidoglycan/LPS O-acetylase OafA/YrhL